MSTSPPKPALSVTIEGDATQIEGRNIGLRARHANDTNGVQTYEWRQISGRTIQLRDTDLSVVNFNAPSYWATDNEYKFGVEITDSSGAIASTEFDVSVTPRFERASMSNTSSVYNGLAYRFETLTGDIDYFEIETIPSDVTRIVVRSVTGDVDVAALDSNDLATARILGVSEEAGSTNEEIWLTSLSQDTLVLEITGIPNSDYTVAVYESNPFIEQGFPKEALRSEGTYSNSVLATVIGNIDDDPELEILASGLATGPVYAWNHDGTSVPGWPESSSAPGAAFISLGNLQSGTDALEVAADFGGTLASCALDQFVFSGNAGVAQGWPRTNCRSSFADLPTLIDIDNDGVDEVFFGPYGHYADGSLVSAWSTSRTLSAPILADITGDGVPEYVSTGTFDKHVNAFDLDGSLLPGFPAGNQASRSPDPLKLPLGNHLLADMNGDGTAEILVFYKLQEEPFGNEVQLIDGDGSELWARRTDDSATSALSPSLADLDNDGLPEVLIQTTEKVWAWSGTGELFENFPMTYLADGVSRVELGTATPLIGDVTGDGAPNIVVTDSQFISVLNLQGEVVHRVRVAGLLATPAIGDIDNDGRNEIVYAAHPWNGNVEFLDMIWAIDLGGNNHGSVQWGQLRGDAYRSGKWPTRN